MTKHVLVSVLGVFLFCLNVGAQSTISITTSGGDYYEEKWVSITTEQNGGGTFVWGQGDGTYANGAGLLTNEIITLPAGTYYVNCYDMYDDSWDGTNIRVMSYGVVLLDESSPSDGNDDDDSSSWESPAIELEASYKIIVPEVPSCFSPENIVVTDITSSSANITWSAGEATTWEVVVQPVGTGEPTTDGTVGTVVMATNFSPTVVADESYEVYIRTDCGVEDGKSTWSIPYTFRTGYCIPGTTRDVLFLKEFTTTEGLVNISNVSNGYHLSGYADNTTEFVQVEPGGSFRFNAASSSTSFYTGGLSIWIDWNKDFIFDDTEKVYNTTSTINGALGGRINVSALQAEGDYRMRVSYDQGTGNPSAPCSETIRDGEFEDFTVRVGALAPLPVELAGVEGIVLDGFNLLNWTTNSELNNSHFEVQRSKDGISFSTIGRIEGNGTTTELSHYSFEDIDPLVFGYYRLKQVDFDGESEYSQVIYLERNFKLIDKLSVFPNPTKDVSIVKFLSNSDNKSIKLTLTNMLGQNLKQYSWITVQGYNEIELDLGSLSNGVYFLSVEQNGRQSVHKICKD